MQQRLTLQQRMLQSGLIKPTNFRQIKKKVFKLNQINFNQEEIVIEKEELTDKDVAVICQKLATNTVVKKLSFIDTNISATGMKSIASLIMTNSILEKLELSNSDMETRVSNVEKNTLGGASGINSLATALEMNSTLKELNLNYQTLSDKDIEKLCQKIPSSLIKLSLISTKMGDNGAKSIANLLVINLSLETLNLGKNYIKAQGIKEIALSLQINSTLKSLNLSCNKSKDEPKTGDKFIPLFKALLVNTTLETFDLSDNHIGDKEANQMAKVLEKNSSIKEVHFHGCNITNIGAKSFAQTIKTNNDLTKLNFYGNKIKDEGVKLLVESPNTNVAVCLLFNKYQEKGVKAMDIKDQFILNKKAKFTT